MDERWRRNSEKLVKRRLYSIVLPPSSLISMQGISVLCVRFGILRRQTSCVTLLSSIVDLTRQMRNDPDVFDNIDNSLFGVTGIEMFLSAQLREDLDVSDNIII